jgi:hypothetical protein
MTTTAATARGGGAVKTSAVRRTSVVTSERRRQDVQESGRGCRRGPAQGLRAFPRRHRRVRLLQRHHAIRRAAVRRRRGTGRRFTFTRRSLKCIQVVKNKNHTLLFFVITNNCVKVLHRKYCNTFALELASLPFRQVSANPARSGRHERSHTSRINNYLILKINVRSEARRRQKICLFAAVGLLLLVLSPVAQQRQDLFLLPRHQLQPLCSSASRIEKQTLKTRISHYRFEG